MKIKNNRGFTIVELMTVILIGGILMAIAVPNYTTMVKNNCLTSKTNAIIGALQIARSSAITLHADVTAAALCRMDVNDDDLADGACSNTNEFGGGIIIFRDQDGDGLADNNVAEDINNNGVLDTGEDSNGNGVLDTSPELIKTLSFTCPATVDETANRNSFIYASNGAALPQGTFNVCDDRVSTEYTGRQISLSVTGRPTTNSTFTCP